MERRRKIQIKFYVDEYERSLIERKMKLSKIRNMGAYLRKVAIDGYTISVDYSDIKSLVSEVNKIGVNINQIAKHVNETHMIYSGQMEEIQQKVNEIWQLLRSNLSKAL